MNLESVADSRAFKLGQHQAKLSDFVFVSPVEVSCSCPLPFAEIMIPFRVSLIPPQARGKLVKVCSQPQRYYHPIRTIAFPKQ
jgi:hypothetical protein